MEIIVRELALDDITPAGVGNLAFGRPWFESQGYLEITGPRRRLDFTTKHTDPEEYEADRLVSIHGWHGTNVEKLFID